MSTVAAAPIPESLAPLLGMPADAGRMPGVCIAGRWSEGAGRALEVFDPARGARLSTVRAAGPQAVGAAVEAASCAFAAWSGLTPQVRGEFLAAIAQAVRTHAEALGALQMLCNGKPAAEAELDIGDIAATFDYYAQLCRSGAGLHAAPVDLPADGFAADVQFVPCGVVGLIVPWNFPMVTTAWKLAPALAAGCTVVLKPSELTPLAEIALLRLMQSSGLPDGVVNLVCGDAETGAALLSQPQVAKLSFTGSTAVGKQIMRAAADRVQRVSLELGGKSSLIVCADADLDQAAELALGGAFFNAGQICSATSRILVDQRVYEDFAQRFVARVASLKTGLPQDAGTTLGPLISAAHRARVLAHAEAGKRAAKVLWDGGVPEGDGYFAGPVVLGDVPLDAACWREEIFGPVACLRAFASEDEAVERANDTEYGLVATIASGDPARARGLASRLKAGTVWINAPQVIFPQTGWGGFGQSGIGRELGPWGLRAYQEIRHVVVAG
jgi:betaine-aldehyde dehydrogenase